MRKIKNKNKNGYRQKAINKRNLQKFIQEFANSHEYIRIICLDEKVIGCIVVMIINNCLNYLMVNKRISWSKNHDLCFDDGVFYA